MPPGRPAGGIGDLPPADSRERHGKRPAKALPRTARGRFAKSTAGSCVSRRKKTPAASSSRHSSRLKATRPAPDLSHGVALHKASRKIVKTMDTERAEKLMEALRRAGAAYLPCLDPDTIQVIDACLPDLKKVAVKRGKLKQVCLVEKWSWVSGRESMLRALLEDKAFRQMICPVCSAPMGDHTRCFDAALNLYEVGSSLRAHTDDDQKNLGLVGVVLLVSASPDLVGGRLMLQREAGRDVPTRAGGRDGIIIINSGRNMVDLNFVKPKSLLVFPAHKMLHRVCKVVAGERSTLHLSLKCPEVA